MALNAKLGGYEVSDHFRGITKMVRLGSGAEREVELELKIDYTIFVTFS